MSYEIRTFRKLGIRQMKGLEAIFGVIFIFSIALFIAEKGTVLVVGKYATSSLQFVIGLIVFISLLSGSIFIMLGEPLSDVIKLILLLVGMVIALFSSSVLSQKVIGFLTNKKVETGSGGEFLVFGVTIALYLGSILALVTLIY